jgi:chemotaxis protein methyltransferase CheR
MTMTSGAVTMTQEEFLLIADLIYDYCGIALPESVKYLVERRLQPRLTAHGLTNFRDYYRLIKYGREQSGEFDEIVERITTNETYFFRESYQLKAFTEEILPIVTDGRDPVDRIRLWSAGCASGEEPYSLAMLVREAPAARGFTFDIFGNDISKKVLRLARAGIYRETSFRQTEKIYRDKYFRRGKDGWRVIDEIRNAVTFGHVNLTDETSMALIANVDVIFCRNVLIYFAADSRARLIDAFYRKLRPGGFLLLGHSESLINTSTQFELMPLKNDIVYRRPPEVPRVSNLGRVRT